MARGALPLILSAENVIKLDIGMACVDRVALDELKSIHMKALINTMIFMKVWNITVSHY